MKKLPLLLLSVASCWALSGCVLPMMPSSMYGEGETQQGALLCSDFGSSPEAMQVDAFLRAGARFEADANALADEVEGVCEGIAADLGMPVPAAEPGYAQVDVTCSAVSNEIALIVNDALPRGAELAVDYTPAECTVELEAMTSCVAACDASFSAEGNASCEGGEWAGTCSGTCTGECRVDGSSNAVNGFCAGICEGSCDVAMEAPQCSGDVRVEADASCEAVCEAEVALTATCSEPQLSIEAALIVDQVASERMNTLIASLHEHYPRLLAAQAKLERVVESGAAMVETFEGAVDAAGTLGLRAGACLAASTTGAAQSLATVEVTLSVSVEVSASVSTTAGGS